MSFCACNALAASVKSLGLISQPKCRLLAILVAHFNHVFKTHHAISSTLVGNLLSAIAEYLAESVIVRPATSNAHFTKAHALGILLTQAATIFHSQVGVNSCAKSQIPFATLKAVASGFQPTLTPALSKRFTTFHLAVCCAWVFLCILLSSTPNFLDNGSTTYLSKALKPLFVVFATSDPTDEADWTNHHSMSFTMLGFCVLFLMFNIFDSIWSLGNQFWIAAFAKFASHSDKGHKPAQVLGITVGITFCTGFGVVFLATVNAMLLASCAGSNALSAIIYCTEHINHLMYLIISLTKRH